MPKKYENPPIIEVVLEIQFPDDYALDPTIPGFVFSRIKEHGFTEKSRDEVCRFLIRPGVQPKAVVNPVSVFSTKDGKMSLKIAESQVYFEKKKPYHSWEELAPNIRVVMDSFFCEVKPSSIAKISLTYVNLIVVPQNPVKLSDFFQFLPSFPIDMGNPVSTFICGVIFPKGTPGTAARVELQMVKSSLPGSSQFLLPIEYATDKPEDLFPDRLMEWLKAGNDEIGRLFELSIKDPLRKIFREVKNER